MMVWVGEMCDGGRPVGSVDHFVGRKSAQALPHCQRDPQNRTNVRQSVCVCVCVCVPVCVCVCVAVVSSQCHLVPCRFVQRLTLLDQDFRGAVDSYNQSHDRPVVSEETMQQILSNVGSLRLLNTDFLDKLEERFRGW